MSPEEREALEAILREQAAARDHLARIDARIEALRTSLASATRKEETQPAVSLKLASVIPTAEATPPPLPPPPTRPPERQQEERSSAAAEPQSIELRLGTYWLVRIGMVVLLTGLVFLANYAYQNFFGRLGPGGKISILYLISFGLLATGFWLERGRETLRNYARVLVAGGAAAVYYTTFAAHHVQRLRVIESPVTGGFLLVAWAGIVIWMAERRRSQSLGIFAILLGYYASVVNPVTSFTLVSNLVLTSAAVFFLLRNRWAAISFAALAGTYVSYGFWRAFHGGFNPTLLHLTPGSFWTGNLFLAGYWVLFTAGAFLSTADSFRGAQRAAFTALNTASFFALAALSFPPVYPGQLWIFSATLGGVLLALAAAAWRWRSDDQPLRASFTTQGLILITLAIVLKFTGYQLALTLAFESFVLLVAGVYRENLILRLGAAITAVLAVLYGFDSVAMSGAAPALTGTALTTLLLASACWLERQRARNPDHPVLIGIFSAGAVVMTGWTLGHHHGPDQLLAPLLALAALAAVAAFPAHRVAALAICGQALLLVANVQAWEDAHRLANGWAPAVGVIVLTLIAAETGRRQQLPLLSHLATQYLWHVLAAFTLLVVVHEAAEPRHAFLIILNSGIALLLLGMLVTNKAGCCTGGGLITVALVVFLIRYLDRSGFFWPDLAGCLALLILEQGFRRVRDREESHERWHVAAIAAGLGALWIYLSRWIEQGPGNSYLTAGWAVFALLILTLGFVLRERAYRVGGLIILALALSRIVFVDVWQLETLYRILSFMVLGIVLLLLGFLYNRFQEKIRQWL